MWYSLYPPSAREKAGFRKKKGLSGLRVAGAQMAGTGGGEGLNP